MKKKIVLSMLLLVLVSGGIYGYKYISGLKTMYDSMQGIDMTVVEPTSDPTNDEATNDKQNTEQSKTGSDSDKASESSASESSQESVTTNVQVKDNGVSKEQIEKAKEEITFTDKAKATKMVMTKLGPSDINRLTKLSAGGLDPEEKKEAVGIAYSKFSPEELELIKRIYHGSK